MTPTQPSDETRSAQAAVEGWRARGRLLELDVGTTFVLDVPATRATDMPPLFVLHGFPTCSFDWRAVVPALSAERRVVLFDFVGFGLSAKPDVRYGIRRYADQAEQVASALGLERVTLVTHDLGDSVGGELLARDLDGELGFAVDSRILTNGSIYLELAQLSAGQRFLLDLPDARVDLAAQGIDPGQGYQGGIAGTFSPAHQPSAEELTAQWLLVSHERGHTLLPRTIRYIEDRRAEEARFTGAIERHPSSLGVVWGAQDPIAVFAMTDRLLAARADARLSVLEDVAHYPMVEAPERFAAAVLDLLAC